MTAENSKILVVDDEPEFREILVFDFENSGYSTVEAESASSAIDMLKKHPDIKIIISDIKMPDGDGVTLLKSIQEIKLKENINLIFVTGFSDLGVDEALDLGADGFMMKPFNRRALTTMVERLLLPEDERWAKIEPAYQIDKNFDIKINFPSLDLAKKTHALNIGRGGMFLACSEVPPAVGAIIKFNVDFDQGPLKNLQGQGVIRWRRAAAKPDLPIGFGVEYLFIEDEGRAFLINSQIQCKQLAFIPKN